jgi:serine/threonine protein phosphatase PrpC
MSFRAAASRVGWAAGRGGGSVRFAGVTDIGKLRDTNEDSYCLEEIAPAGGVWLLAVADGLGGYRGGEVASRIAIQTIREHALREPEAAPPAAGAGEAWPRRLHAAITAAHARIVREAAAVGEDLSGMGTTLTAVIVDGMRLCWGHVGDSRAYVLRSGRLTLLTRDHSVTGQLVQDGVLAEEAARQHPQRNLLTQALGFAGELQVETGVTEMRGGDWLILATDGLTAVVRSDEIARSARRAEEPLPLCERLVELANARGGPDNITVIAARA